VVGIQWRRDIGQFYAIIASYLIFIGRTGSGIIVTSQNYNYHD